LRQSGLREAKGKREERRQQQNSITVPPVDIALVGPKNSTPKKKGEGMFNSLIKGSGKKNNEFGLIKAIKERQKNVWRGDFRRSRGERNWTLYFDEKKTRTLFVGEGGSWADRGKNRLPGGGVEKAADPKSGRSAWGKKEKSKALNFLGRG